jgi:hypothetical protein
MAKTKEELIEIGKRWGSPLVLREAREALVRWVADQALLTGWGFGPSRRQRFEELVNQLAARHGLYAGQVGAKLAATPALASAVTEARTWCQRAQGVIDERAEADEAVARRVQALGSRLPEEPERLESFTQNLLQILTEERLALDADSATDAFFAEGAAALATLKSAGLQKTARKETKEVGTSELDELDGQIYVELGKLNKKARQAHNAAGNQTRAGHYVYHYLIFNSPGGADGPTGS